MNSKNSGNRFGLVLMFVLGASVYLGAQAPPQFKTDMQMSRPGSGAMNGKMFFGSSKVRMELDMGGMNQVIIVDTAKKLQYMIMPSEKMYMEMSLNAPSGGPSGMRAPKLDALDPANPCSTTGMTACKHIGPETVNGYPTEKWELTADGQQATLWIGTKLRMPIKTLGKDGATMEFKNIVEGEQPANLFEVPAGYQKMQMPGMGAMPGM